MFSFVNVYFISWGSGCDEWLCIQAESEEGRMTYEKQNMNKKKKKKKQKKKRKEDQKRRRRSRRTLTFFI
jgi:hypothetical protein